MIAECAGFSQLHIDVARFATDDFNLFHDLGKWRRLRGNPFGGPVVMGFQTETWLAEVVAAYRRAQEDSKLLRTLRFSNYQINFAAALKPGQSFELVIKPSQWDDGRGVLGNRVLIRSAQGVVLMGYQKLSRQPLILPDLELGELPPLTAEPDRGELPGTPYFLKRKYMTTANAKNFLLGSLVDPARYFDELEGRVQFPEMFPVSFISCALLERARLRGHDFEIEPMVYTRHEISVDRKAVTAIRSNDVLHVLVAPDCEEAGEFQSFRCVGLIGDRPVFRALTRLAPLKAVVKALERR
ncbi:MAG: hypothetical protein ACPW60_02880 [Methylohalobius sp. ZOD2]